MLTPGATKKDSVSKKSNITQPHDRLIKKLLSNAATARDILNLYLPREVVEITNLECLELQRDSFIDDEHRAFAVDILYKTSFHNSEGYIWILLEHQSKSDPWMPVRIFKYIAIIWDHLRKNSKEKQIPLVYPLVIYNGKQVYSHSMNLKDFIYPESSQELYKNMFTKPFQLIDLTQIKDESLRSHLQQHVKGIALLLTLKHIFDKNLQTIFETTLLDVYKQLDQFEYREEVADMLYYLLNEGKFLSKNKFWTILHEEFSNETENNVMTIAQQLRAEGHAQGHAKGLVEGNAEAKRFLVIRMLESNLSLDLIAKITELPLAKVKELKRKNEV